MGMYGSDSEDEGGHAAADADASARAQPAESRGAQGGHHSDSEDGVDILGAIAAATENAAEARSPAKQQNGEEEVSAQPPEAEPEEQDEPLIEEPPVPRRQCVSIPAKYMEGVEIPPAPEGEVAPETLVRSLCCKDRLTMRVVRARPYCPLSTSVRQTAVRDCLASLRTRPGVNLNHEFRKSHG